MGRTYRGIIMTTRTITKALAGVEDLLLGVGSVNQTRNGSTVAISKINASEIPYSGNTAGVDLITTKERIDSFGNSGDYTFANDTGAVGSYTLFTIPDNTTIVEAWYEVVTAPTSAGLATISLGVETDGADEILSAKAFDDSIWMTEGYHDTLVFPRAANFTTKTTAERNVVLTIGTADLTAGVIYVWCRYITSV